MKSVGYVNSFTAGELGEEAWERSDLVQHAKGMSPGRNLLVTPTGPAVSRGGFWDRGPTKDEQKFGRVWGFVRSKDDALILEFFDLGFRVWTPAGDPVMSGDVQVEVVTPWPQEILASMWLKQVGDVVYVTHPGGYAVHVIERFSNTSWQVAPLEFRDGPWLPENIDPAFTIACSGIIGTVEVSASKDLFLPEHVGACFRLRAQSSGAGMGGWTSGYDVKADNELMVSDGRIYRAITQARDYKTGTNPPVHDRGWASDGEMIWEYLHDGAARIQILEVYHARLAAAQILDPCLPTQGRAMIVSNSSRQVLQAEDYDNAFPATPFWAEQAFSPAKGWPRAPVEEVDERLVMGGTNFRPSQAFLTRTAGFGPTYTDFKPGMGTGRVVDDDAVRVTAGKAGAPLVWMVNTTFLIAGTSDAEYVICGGNIDDPITPDSHRAREIANFGVASVAPVVVHGPPLSLLYVTRSREMMRELKVAPDVSTDSADLTILVDHIRERGFAELAWQHPEDICWARMDDGELMALTYHQQHEVRAWTTQSLPGGFAVESITTAPATGGGDILWAIVRREKDGQWQRRLWRLARRAEAMFIDAAERYQGEPVSSVTGLDHLIGETVTIIADGAQQADRVVDDTGRVDLTIPASDVTVGLPLLRLFISVPLDLQGVGSTLGRSLQIQHIDVTLSCVEAMVGDGTPQGTSPVRRRQPSYLAAPVVERFRSRVGVGSGAGRGRRVFVETSAPYDLKIHSMRIEGDVEP